ncbi:MAG TPA: efflux RND transporter periplasmic adaptor subunit [Gemmata sp.]|nr:efflux RND transporter periplasmic adaptor subunit [Gemmata sp.]
MSADKRVRTFHDWAIRLGRVVAILAIVLVAGGSAAWLAAGATRRADDRLQTTNKDAAAERIRRTGHAEILVPPSIQTSLGLKSSPAAKSTRKRKLPAFQGTLNFDSNHLARVQSTFPGRVEELGTFQELLTSAIPHSPPATAPRPLRVGDEIKKDTVLAVVWSKELGEKKSEYIDAVSKLGVDEVTLKRLQELYEDNATTERAVREQERTVQSDRVAVERAEATLRAWKVPAAELESLHAEAAQLSRPELHFFSFPLQKRTDPARWARVEIRAPIDGVILEKNVTAVGQVVDPSMDLYRIGDLSSLAVWVHLFEEDLPLLRGITTPVPWVVAVPSWPGSSFAGRMETIAASIDPSQHTALVTGTVENPKRELKAGMSVTVTIELPPPPGQIEVPTEAVIEDGRESYVYLLTAPGSNTFVRKAVKVVQRSRDVIAIAEEAGGVKAGDQVVTSGSLLLSEAVNDLPEPKE